jgi:hypothetical protein
MQYKTRQDNVNIDVSKQAKGSNHMTCLALSLRAPPDAAPAPAPVHSPLYTRGAGTEHLVQEHHHRAQMRL